MTTIYDEGRARETSSTWLLAALAAVFVALTAAVLAGSPLAWAIALLAVCMSVFAVGGVVLLRWDSLIGILVLVICLIPIGRYSLPSTLPFELEPYRVFVAGLVALWLISLLIDPRVSLRPTGLEGPFIALLLVILLSEAANFAAISDQNLFADVAKQLTFFVSFIAVVFAVVSVTTTRDSIDRILKVLVGGGTFVAVAAIADARVGLDVFAHVQQVIPILENQGLGRIEPGRGGLPRVYGSSEHPIALGAMLAMLVPLSVYLAIRTARRRWLFAGVVLVAASLATISRTSVLMLLLELGVFAVLRPLDVRRLWVIAPIFVVAVQVTIPGTLGTLKDSFFPEGGLVAEQSAARVGSGRVVTLGPSLEVWKSSPLLGVGYGTRISVPGPKRNAYILDNQWLGTLLEVGIAGVFVWLWLFLAFCGRMLRAARSSSDPDAWLFTALLAAVGSFAAGMFFYDAFAFTQVTFIAFILIAIGLASLRVTGALSPPGVRGEGG